MSSSIVPDELRNGQITRVDARVAGGPYGHESDEVRRAADALDAIIDHRSLYGPVRDLTPGTGKPQFLLQLADETGTPVVLKVYGRLRPAEAAVQARWCAAGVPTPEIRSSGDEPVSWLLMSVLSGSPPARERGPLLTRRLARTMSTAHSVDAHDLSGPVDLASALEKHLAAVTSAAEAHGYRVPRDILGRARTTMSSDLPTCLHGDLSPVNLMESRDSLHILDTCGYFGPAEFDAARWCARVGGADGAERELGRWLTEERGLDPERARTLLGLELIMEAGVREIIKDERGDDAGPRDSVTDALLAAADRLDAS
ncbi:phosphotransferase family protein [Actinomycetospora termitidis]|uniref:Phosphotransferase n=1 Tax=Actinomycetospora termitidis TaxID=3053470 RepID=A0ABT7MEQ9_9PSEU|nr:phosphotransferase [Actinomycetospora sp. Odt1-22]MDL5158936.1 phosphotransferase [Actinomycetospora sp. Odt1-22]